MWEGRRKDHVLAVERRYGKWCGVQSETFTIRHGVEETGSMAVFFLLGSKFILYC